MVTPWSAAADSRWDINPLTRYWAETRLAAIGRPYFRVTDEAYTVDTSRLIQSPVSVFGM